MQKPDGKQERLAIDSMSVLCLSSSWKTTYTHDFMHAGFVAISQDKKDICVVFRGTQQPDGNQEWASNLNVNLSSWDEVDSIAAATSQKTMDDNVWVEMVCRSLYSSLLHL